MRGLPPNLKGEDGGLKSLSENSKLATSAAEAALIELRYGTAEAVP